jgi:hypothetical protein
MRRTKRILTVLFLSACVVVYGYSAVDATAGRVFSINVDLSQPASIVWPFEIAVVGDLGEKGLRIGPKVGAGWRGKVGGKATYRFYVPEDGTYHTWAYALWFDKCANAIYAKVDHLDRAIIGNDPIYQKWHWVRGFGVPLKKGAHALELSNHSDHISLQKVLLINSGIALPDDCGLIFSDVFYDGFDGCHIGNFASWDVVCGQWGVEKPEAQHRYFENALIGRSKDSAVIVYRADDWSDYSLHVAVNTPLQVSERAAVGILFGVQGPDHFHRLTWRPLAGTEAVDMRLSRQTDQEVECLASFQTVCPADVWHQVEVVLENGTIRVNLNEVSQIDHPVNHDISGGIGLCVEGESMAYFDDVHVRTVTETAEHDPGRW